MATGPKPTNNPAKMRDPFGLQGKVPLEVSNAHQFAFDGILDLQGGLADLNTKVSALQPAAAAPATTTTVVEVASGSGGGGGNANSLGVVEYQTAATYVLQSEDYGNMLALNGTTTVDLNSAVQVPFFCFFENLSGSTVTLVPTTGTVNGSASVGIAAATMAIAFFDGADWVVGLCTPVAGLSVTVPLAKLTVGGANGSLTFVSGILTARTNPT